MTLLQHFKSFCIFGLAIIATSTASAYSISEQEINNYLTKKSVIQNKVGIPFLFELDYKLRDLQTKIGQNENKKVEISGAMDGIFQLQNKQFPAQLNLVFDTVPYYDPAKGQIYLKDIRILRWSGSPEKYMAQLQGAMPFISENLSAIMSQMPIYTLDEKNPKELLIKKFAQGIKVENGKIEVETKLF